MSVPTRFPCLAVALLGFFGCSTEVDDHDEGGSDLIDDPGKADALLDRLPALELVHDDGGWLTILSEVPVPDVSSLVATITETYRFTAEKHGWIIIAGSLAEPLEVILVSSDTMRELWPGVAAFCPGPRRIVVSERLLLGGYGVLVHEFTHLQHNRMGGRIPYFLEEGSAQDLQRRYQLEHGLTERFHENAALLVSLGRDEAIEMIDHFRAGDDLIDSKNAGTLNQNESLGCLFVEFVRVRLWGGHADAVERIGWVVESMPATMLRTDDEFEPTYDAALQAAFGAGATTIEDAFTWYVRATEGRPVARLAGTVFEGW